MDDRDRLKINDARTSSARPDVLGREARKAAQTVKSQTNGREGAARGVNLGRPITR